MGSVVTRGVASEPPPPSSSHPGPEADDAFLIRAVANGDRHSLAALYDRYSGVMLAIGQRILRTPREAEDLLHDVFLEVWRCAGDWDGNRGTVRAWLLLRMRSRALDRRKSAAFSRNVALGDHAGDVPRAVSDEDPTLGADRAAVTRALAELPDEQRTVLTLAYYEGLSCSEIAEKIHVPIGTVKSRAAAALAKLRACLDVDKGGQP
jgi:RNA polymerase sigma-70 factor (ECF subfamily)